jgi:type I restriction enzyme S subunit
MDGYKRHFSLLMTRQVFYPEFGSTEQEIIADCLSSLDDLISAENRKLETLKTYKKGLMQYIFPQPGQTQPRLRFPEFRDGNGWISGKCSDVSYVLQGYGFPDVYQGQCSGNYPFYKVSDISSAVAKGEKWIDGAQNYIDDEVLNLLKATTVPESTIIFAKIGEAIRKDRRAMTIRPAVLDNNVAGVKAIFGKITDEFLFYLWTTVSLIDYAGGVVPAVSKTAIENIPISYPEEEAEQQKVADCLSFLDTNIAKQVLKINLLKLHKRGLMQQLFPAIEED